MTNNELYEKTGYILIDFDNFLKKPINDVLPTELEFFFISFVQKLLNESNKFERINIRLYGGWYQDGIISRRGQELLKKIAEVSIFPYIDPVAKHIIRGEIELAESLLAVPELIWDNTYQEKRGIPALRVDYDKISDTCNLNRDNCPIYILKSFTKRKDKSCKVTGCTTIHNEVFFQRGQKMIDTIISCDLQYCSSIENIVKVLLISSDTDLIPALFFSSSIHMNQSQDSKYILGFDEIKEQAINRYAEYFPAYNIKTFEYEL